MKSGSVLYEQTCSSGSGDSSRFGLRLAPLGLTVRLLVFALLLGLELIVFSISFDTKDLPRQSGLLRLIGDWGPGVLQAAIASAALLITFGSIQISSAFRQISQDIARLPVSRQMIAAHGCAVFSFAGLSHLLFHFDFGAGQTNSLAIAWLSAGILALATALNALAPPAALLALVRHSGKAGLIALTGGVGSAMLGPSWISMWTATIDATFYLVHFLLSPFLADLIVDPLTRTIGTAKFHVIIHASCSGLEGAGLMLVFGTAWLWFFRKECRFPHALLLLPAGVLLVWLLNSARIAALILIGDAGFPAVAMGGFHSQAGWIGVNAVALGFSFALCRIPWLMAAGQRRQGTGENPAAWYLMPFLAILAASMLAQAAPYGFEWLYPLRFGAAAGALLYFRRRYKELDWRIGWIGVAAGVGAFAIWLGLDWLNPSQATGTVSGLQAGLQGLSGPARNVWVVFRILAAVITAPLAEELAFRGYLLRRLVSPDFETVSLKHALGKSLLFPILISSFAFGIMHGDRWLEGTLAGVIYALAARHRGRIGDAVIAHATTNALLAVCVFYTGNWNLL